MRKTHDIVQGQKLNSIASTFYSLVATIIQSSVDSICGDTQYMIIQKYLLKSQKW